MRKTLLVSYFTYLAQKEILADISEMKVQIPPDFFLKGTKITGIYNSMRDQVTGNRPYLKKYGC